MNKHETTTDKLERLARLEEAVRWVLTDAGFAAPETWPDRCGRWIVRLQRAQLGVDLDES